MLWQSLMPADSHSNPTELRFGNSLDLIDQGGVLYVPKDNLQALIRGFREFKYCLNVIWLAITMAPLNPLNDSNRGSA